MALDGGKNAFNGKLAKWIIGLMPAHIHYVEPYLGGGAVLLHKAHNGISEVVNDLDGDLSNFWQILATTPDRMLRELWGTPFSEEVWQAAEAGLADDDRVRRATAFFIRCRQSRQGLCKDFATLSRTRTRRGMNEQVSSWLTAIEGLPEVHDRLKRVVIFNRDALGVIREQDGEQTCFYLDPTYFHETRGSVGEYKHEMTVGDHQNLLTLLCHVQGSFLLSGYRSPLYDNFAERQGWTRHEFSIVNNASSSKKKETKTECVWTNY